MKTIVIIAVFYSTLFVSTQLTTCPTVLGRALIANKYTTHHQCSYHTKIKKKKLHAKYKKRVRHLRSFYKKYHYYLLR